MDLESWILNLATGRPRFKAQFSMASYTPQWRGEAQPPRTAVAARAPRCRNSEAFTVTPVAATDSGTGFPDLAYAGKSLRAPEASSLGRRKAYNRPHRAGRRQPPRKGSNKMKCPACQNEVNVDSVYCPKCGEKLEQAAEQASAAIGSPAGCRRPRPSAEEQPAGEESRRPSERLMERARGRAQTPAAEPVSGWSKGGYSPRALNARFLATCLVTAALLAARCLVVVG